MCNWLLVFPLQFQSNVEDTLRYFAEECDSIQGFHLLSDWSTGFGALATCIAELIVDEYASKSIISFPVSSASCADNVSLLPSQVLSYLV